MSFLSKIADMLGVHVGNLVAFYPRLPMDTQPPQPWMFPTSVETSQAVVIRVPRGGMRREGTRRDKK